VFQKQIPDFAWRGSVVFMPNLFGFDAGGGRVGGEEVLVVGLDTIAKIDGPHADLSVLISTNCSISITRRFIRNGRTKAGARTSPCTGLSGSKGSPPP